MEATDFHVPFPTGRGHLKAIAHAQGARGKRSGHHGARALHAKGAVHPQAHGCLRIGSGHSGKDLIERLPSPGDRRAKVVRLTPEGRKAAAVVAAASDDIRGLVLSDIDDREIMAALAVMPSTLWSSARRWAHLVVTAISFSGSFER